MRTRGKNKIGAAVQFDTSSSWACSNIKKTSQNKRQRTAAATNLSSRSSQIHMVYGMVMVSSWMHPQQCSVGLGSRSESNRLFLAMIATIQATTLLMTE